MKRVVVLGGTGMLGGMVACVLSAEEELSVTAAARRPPTQAGEASSRCAWAAFDALESPEARLESLLRDADWAVNAIGLIKPCIREDAAEDVERAVRTNALFPHELARAALRSGCRVIQIETDCVYSGLRGGYRESDLHDPLDVYGKTKSLGEVAGKAVVHLRCSIIGPESRGHLSLLEWFLRQRPGATVPGYLNHRWNGLTTLAFARICRGIIRGGAQPGRRLHVVPADRVTKAELLELMRAAYGRPDITIEPENTPVAVDRTLATEHPGDNLVLWRAAGYEEAPTIAGMVREMAAFTGRPGGAA